jgi:hypothetical protein
MLAIRKGMKSMSNQLKSLEEAKKQLLDLKNREFEPFSGWSPYVIFVHCSKTIEYSMVGYPELKPLIIRNTIGKVVIAKFMKQGFMKHDLMADVAGSPVIEDKGSFQEGMDILLTSIEKFIQYQGDLRPHLLFGKLNKESYDQYFAMHIADHLREFSAI